ncbi:unnamed protein product, partial [Nippostrongylus brasiliensis]|uniref:CUB domain-containing protein n=1 Tax=Nippostrongylus brasiliensis TaxID=27835 RepID=A0A0N4XFL6_NIPBR
GFLSRRRGIDNTSYFENEFSKYVERSPDQVVTVHFSKDSQCGSLSANNAFEVYKYRPVSSGTVITPCQFPNWIRGEYDLIAVDGDALEFSPTSSNSAPVISRCVHIADDRFLVYTETKCGDPIGYHCLWFAPRSESLIEFKSTSLIVRRLSMDGCSDFCCHANTLWNSWVISLIEGILSYTTPPDLQTQDCYNVTIDCEDRSSMRVTASHCATGVIFDGKFQTFQIPQFCLSLSSTNKGSENLECTRTFGSP